LNRSLYPHVFMCESEFLYFKVRLYITNQYRKIKKIQLQNKWFEKKVFKRDFNCKMNGLKKKLVLRASNG